MKNNTLKTLISGVIFLITSLQLNAKVDRLLLPFNPGISVQYLGDEDIHAIPRYEKFEIGIALPEYLETRILRFMQDENDSLGLNPFLHWNMRVYAEFTHIESGEKKTVDGFYFQNYKAREDLSKWDRIDDRHQFRIRTAPSIVGDWKMKVFFTYLEGGSIKTLTRPELIFTVVESDNPGYMSIAKNKRNFEMGGEKVVPIGINLPWPYDVNSYFPKDGIDRVTPKEYEAYKTSMKVYAKSGGKYFRMLMAPSSNGLEFEKAGNYFERMDYAFAMDEIFDLMREEDLYVNLNMMLHTWMEIHAAYYMFRYDWDDKDCGSRTNGYKSKFNLEKPSDLFLNEEAMRYMKERYRYIISRWGYSTQIHTLEILSETGHLNEDRPITMKEINGKMYCQSYTGEMTRPYDTDSTIMWAQYKFNKEIAKLIKVDLGHTEHVLAVSYLDFTFNQNEKLRRIEKTFELDYIDAIGINYYNTSAAKDWQMYKNVKAYHDRYDKPVYFSETGPADQVAGCDKNSAYEIDSWLLMFSGVAGYNIWSGEKIDPKYAEWHGPNVWKYPISAMNFYNQSEISDEILSGNWSQSQMERKKRNIPIKSGVSYGMISDDKTKSFGVVYNRTYNSNTNFDNTFSSKKCSKMEACDCDNDAPGNWRNTIYKNNDYLSFKQDLEAKHLRKYLELKSLKKRSLYRVIWYDRTGKSISDNQNIKSNGRGVIKLKHESMNVIGADQNPFYLFRLYLLEK